MLAAISHLLQIILQMRIGSARRRIKRKKTSLALSFVYIDVSASFSQLHKTPLSHSLSLSLSLSHRSFIKFSTFSQAVDFWKTIFLSLTLNFAQIHQSARMWRKIVIQINEMSDMPKHALARNAAGGVECRKKCFTAFLASERSLKTFEPVVERSSERYLRLTQRKQQTSRWEFRLVPLHYTRRETAQESHSVSLLLANGFMYFSLNLAWHHFRLLSSFSVYCAIYIKRHII
jgi:uncharacterized membrane protein